MNNRIVLALYKTFVKRGFATLRLNFRGVGKSQGLFDNGIGELSDAASALDWVQSIHAEARTTWVAGYSFGALDLDAAADAPARDQGLHLDRAAGEHVRFHLPRALPSSGIIVQGDADEVVTPNAVQKLVDKLRTQRHITIDHAVIPGANHFFENEMDEMMAAVDQYLDRRLATDAALMFARPDRATSAPPAG